MLEGGGQILRYSAALCAITGQAVGVERVRAKRTRPGLQPQHLTSLRLVEELCEGSLEGEGEGAETGSLEGEGEGEGGGKGKGVYAQAQRSRSQLSWVSAGKRADREGEGGGREMVVDGLTERWLRDCGGGAGCLATPRTQQPPPARPHSSV